MPQTPRREAVFREAMAAELRAEAGAAKLEIPEIARRTGMKEQTVRRTMLHARMATAWELLHFADVFGISPEELLARSQRRAQALQNEADSLAQRMKDALG